MNAAWDSCIPITSENSHPCLDKVSYNHVLQKAKPLNDPDGRHYSAFTYHRLGPLLMEPHNIMEFEPFVKRMHGKPHSHIIKLNYYTFTLLPFLLTEIWHCFFVWTRLQERLFSKFMHRLMRCAFSFILTKSQWEREIKVIISITVNVNTSVEIKGQMKKQKFI